MKTSFASPPKTNEAPCTPEGPVVGRLIGVQGRMLLVTLPDAIDNPVETKSALGLSANECAQAIARSAEVLVVHEQNNPDRPIAVALLDAPTPHVDMVLETSAEPHPSNEPLQRAPFEVVVDGIPTPVEAKEQLVLRCGDASITLHANGRIVLKGNEIESHARGTNRIKGGSVRVN